MHPAGLPLLSFLTYYYDKGGCLPLEKWLSPQLIYGSTVLVKMPTPRREFEIVPFNNEETPPYTALINC